MSTSRFASGPVPTALGGDRVRLPNDLEISVATATAEDELAILERLSLLPRKSRRRSCPSGEGTMTTAVTADIRDWLWEPGVHTTPGVRD